MFVHRLANELVRRGHSVHVASLDPLPQDATYGHVRFVGERAVRSQIGRALLMSFLLRQLERYDWDVLHTSGDDQFYWPRRHATVRTFYGSAAGEAASATSLKRRVFQTFLAQCEQLAARLPDVAVSISLDTARRLPRSDLIIPCAVDTKMFCPSRTGQHSSVPTILFVGTVGGRKRGGWLVDCFKRDIRPHFPSAELWMVSDPPPPALAREPGVRWYGKQAEEDLASLYRSAWVFCLPSTYEGFGIPYVEALASGTPVVATLNPGAVEVLERGAWGRVVADGELGDTLVELLSDDGLREQLSAQGLVRAGHFSLERVAAAYEDAYRLAMRPH